MRGELSVVVTTGAISVAVRPAGVWIVVTMGVVLVDVVCVLTTTVGVVSTGVKGAGV